MLAHMRRHNVIHTTYHKTTKKEGTLEQNSKGGGGGGRIGLDKEEQASGAQIRSDPPLYFNSLNKLLIFKNSDFRFL